MFGRKILNRFVSALIVLIGVSIISFVVIRLGPGDPARMIVGALASDEVVEEQRIRMGLNQPGIVQYFKYVGGLLKGDLGYSYAYSATVNELLASRLPNTIKIGLFGTAIALGIALPFGFIAGTHQGKLVDTGAMFFAVMGQSMSPVWLALIMILLFSVKLGWLPTGGVGSFKYWIMPGLCIGLPGAAGYVRFMRSGLIDTLSEDHITATRARGISQGKVNMKYALKNAMIPIVTSLGMEMGNVIGGSVIVENVFVWPGMGQLMVSAVNIRDYQLVQSLLLVSAVMLVLCNLISDLLYTVIDPRIEFN